MKFTVVGAGAMGLRFGVLLQEAGNEVDFVEGWLPHYNKMKEQGGVYVTREHKIDTLFPLMFIHLKNTMLQMLILFSLN